MALRNQPYIPLYVQDYLTDEKLNLCSLSTQGVYIKIMCILHKQKEYGVFLLKQKDKQNSSNILNFAYKFAKLLPIRVKDIELAITELIEEDVLLVDGDKIYQKRMVKDNTISEARANAGSKGGKITQSTKNFAKAKSEANTESESEYVNENVNKDKSKDVKEIVKIYNDVCSVLPKVQKLTKQRIATVNARIKEYSLAQIGDVIQNTADSRFLNGENDRGWQADFDWIMTPTNFIKILENRYINKNNKNVQSNTEKTVNAVSNILERLDRE